MMFGLSNDQYDYIVKELVLPLEKLQAKIWCFGSRARGDYQRYSDLDLLVVSPKNLRSEIAKIKERLVESSLPFKVDIVQDRDLASSYRSKIETEKIEFRPITKF